MVQKPHSQEQVLKKIVLKNEYNYEWELLEKTDETDETNEADEEVTAETEEEKTLYDLVRLASIDIDSAIDALYDFIEEVRDIDEVPVLVAIDRLNKWEHESSFINPENVRKKLGARNLAMVDAFSLFQYEAPTRGLSVFALTECATQVMSRKHLADATYAIEIPTYDVEELRNCVHHYAATGFLHEKVSPSLLARFKGIAGAVPMDCMEFAAII